MAWVVDIVRHWLNWNRCYANGILIATVCLRVGSMLGLYNRYPSFNAFLIHLAIHMTINTLLPGYLVSLIFPQLCQRQFTTIQDMKVEVGLHFSQQLLAMFLTLLIYSVTSIILNTPVQMMAKNGKSKCRNGIDYFQAVLSYIFLISIWFSIVIGTIGLGSLNVSKLFEICVFGYAFPALKSMVVYFTVVIAKHFDKINGHSTASVSGGDSSLVTMFICGSSIACGLAQLYVIYMTSSNYTLFALQYVPHELIKKASWGTFLRCFRRFRLRNSRRIFTVGSRMMIERNIIESQAAIHTESIVRRETILLIKEDDKAVAEEIVGREFGEDICMFVAGSAVTPYLQEFVFFSSGGYTARGPSYVDLAVCMIGILFVLKNILTIVILASLIRDGIPISHQSAPWISQPRIISIQIIVIVGIMLAMDMALSV